jgi:electron transport complex protein RnfG
MKKLKSSLINMVAVLTVITIVAGAALAAVNYATSSQIEKIKAENLAKGIKQVMGVDLNTDFEYTTEEVGDYTLYKSDLGTAIQSTTNGFGGALKVLVGFDKEGTVLGYTILEHSETPGLGAKASEWFQKGQKGDITGKNPGQANFTVSKDGGDIDAITASTITSRAFLLAVQNAYDELIKQQGGTDATTSATEKGGSVNE